MCHGFGTLMALYKETYKEIPLEFKVWYGDNIQYASLDSYSLSGFKIKTKMSGTSSKLPNRREIAKAERKAWLIRQ